MKEYTLNNTIYIDIREIRDEHKDYCKGARSNNQLLERKNITDFIFARIENEELIVTEKLSRRFGSIFINKAVLGALFDEKEKETLLPAPPLITDQDLVFFKDDDGNEFNVPMRGERTQEGIFFQVKAVMEVFQMENLQSNMQLTRAAYSLNEHYIWFNLSESCNALNKQKEMYLTYGGLRKVIETSRSGVGHTFKKWIDEIVFSAAFGTKEQKVKTCTKVLNVDADHLKAIMSKSPTAISCLYLIDIGISDDGNRVFKYGLSDNIKRRFSEHVKTYGGDIKLDTFILIPLLDLSKAETDFKKCVSRYQYKRGNEAELISLCDEAYINIQNIFNSISRNYCGNVQEQIAIYKHRLELIELECANKLLAKDNQLLAKDNEILRLKMQLAGVAI